MKRDNTKIFKVYQTFKVGPTEIDFFEEKKTIPEVRKRHFEGKGLKNRRRKGIGAETDDLWDVGQGWEVKPSEASVRLGTSQDT